MAQLTAPPPRWQRRPEARPEEILDAAWLVFAEQGYARARLDEVARRAGVSKGTLYLYFDSKETLFREMVRAKVVSSVIRGEERVRQHSGPARELVEWFVREMWTLMGQEGRVQVMRLVQSELPSFPELARFYFEEVILRTRRALEGIIERGVASGEFRPVRPEFVARALPSLLVQLSAVQCFFGEFDPYQPTGDEVVRDATDFVLHGLLARPAEA